LRAALYLRVSTDGQAEHGTSLESQEADTRRLAADLRATVVGVYADTGSGTSWDLDGLNRLLDDAKRGAFNLVVCLHPHRLSRSMGKALVVEEGPGRSGAAVRYAALPHGDNSPEGQLQRNVIAALAEYERERIKLRTVRRRRAKAERGAVVGNGFVPYGY